MLDFLGGFFFYWNCSLGCASSFLSAVWILNTTFCNGINIDLMLSCLCRYLQWSVYSSSLRLWKWSQYMGRCVSGQQINMDDHYSSLYLTTNMADDYNCRFFFNCNFLSWTILGFLLVALIKEFANMACYLIFKCSFFRKKPAWMPQKKSHIRFLIQGSASMSLWGTEAFMDAELKVKSLLSVENAGCLEM